MDITFILVPTATRTYRTFEPIFNKQTCSYNWKKVQIIESLEEMLITSNQGPKDVLKYSLECIQHIQEYWPFSKGLYLLSLKIHVSL